MGCLHVLHVETVVEGVAACPRRNLKSKLDRVVVGSGPLPSVPLMSEAEERCEWEALAVLSLFFAFSTALRSYSSHSLAVFAGVHGGGRGSWNGDVVLARGED